MDDAFLKEILETFRVEADEHIQAIRAGLLGLESSPSQDEQRVLIETVFREAHSLKGAARAVELSDIELICQAAESVFAALKRSEIPLTRELFDGIHRAVDAVEALLAQPDSVPVGSLIDSLAALASGRGVPVPPPAASLAPPAAPAPVESAPAMPAPEPEPAPISAPAVIPASKPDTAAAPVSTPRPARPQAETLRVSRARLDAIQRQVEEMLAIRLAVEQRAAEARDVFFTAQDWKRRFERVEPEFRSALKTASPRLQEFMDWLDRFVRELTDRLGRHAADLERDHRLFQGALRHLREDTRKTLMFPFSSLMDTYPKMVRDLSRERGKEVTLVLTGTDVEIDRRLLEEMKDPFLHLVRNAIDHGIERTDERIAAGKPPAGTLTIAVSQAVGGKIEVVVSDDGRGIQVEKAREAAVRRGILSLEEAAALSEEEALWLVFRSDVSTASRVTEISGRGLGLAIVREKVEAVGGSLSLQSTPGAGTLFRLLLPLTLATSRGMLVAEGPCLYVIPTSAVERVVRVRQDEPRSVSSRPTIEVGGRVLALTRLADLLGLAVPDEEPRADRKFPVLIVGSAERRIGIRVDTVIGEQEILVKSLGPELSHIRCLAGATVLGSGAVVPILNVAELILCALMPRTEPQPMTEETDSRQRSILVVEDSVTSRMLLKNVLEAAGYCVRTAVDGAEALAVLRTDAFDLVVSDVEMPRMNGLDLTRAIRADPKLKELPVILVSSLGTREDRERGIEVGANAYIVKTGFDQESLLQKVARLI